jgi:hypothetical protein
MVYLSLPSFPSSASFTPSVLTDEAFDDSSRLNFSSFVMRSKSLHAPRWSSTFSWRVGPSNYRNRPCVSSFCLSRPKHSVLPSSLYLTFSPSLFLLVVTSLPSIPLPQLSLVHHGLSILPSTRRCHHRSPAPFQPSILTRPSLSSLEASHRRDLGSTFTRTEKGDGPKEFSGHSSFASLLAFERGRRARNPKVSLAILSSRLV